MDHEIHARKRILLTRPICFAQKQEGVSRKLVGFKMVEMGIPRHGYPIVDASGK